MHQAARHFPPSVSAPSAESHTVGDQPGVLRRILDPTVNLGLWQRPADPAITRELSTLDATRLPDVRRLTSPATFDDDLSALLEQQHLDPSAFLTWRTDLARLAALFFPISGNRAVTLRLETTDSDACRRFHVDRTHLRLLCTYRGPGTEWLRDEQVDRSALTHGAANESISRFGEPSRFGTFWVGLLKGEAYLGNAGRGLVHRSPPIAGSGQVRVLFCLDC